jgi:PAS domain S-box-containing protein
MACLPWQTSCKEIIHMNLRRKCQHTSSFLFFAANFLLFLFFVSILLSRGAFADTDGKMRKTGPLVLSASEIDYPPFCIVDENGKPSGFSVELMRAALGAMGRDVSFKTGPWSRVKAWLAKGEVQALPLVGRTPERENLFDFTFPYMSLHGAIVVRKNTTDIRNLQDLDGRQVAVMAGDNAEEFLRRQDRGIIIHTTPTFEQAMAALSKGRYDAVVIQRLVALRLIQEMGMENLKVVNQPIQGFRQDFCFAVKEGDADTLALLNEGLALVMADGTFRRLHAKWFAALQLPHDRPIVIGGDHNYPPFEYLDENGRPTGFAVELTRAIAREMNLNIQIQLGPWARVVEGLTFGDIDAIQGMFYSLERDKTLQFSQPYMISNYVSVSRKGDTTPPATMAALAEQRLVARAGDVILEFFDEHGLKDRVSLVNTQTEVLQAVADGEYDCALVPRRNALYLMEQNNWTNLVLGSHTFFAGEYAYAVPNGSQALLSQFSEGLQVLEKTGEYRRIHEKWLGDFTEEPLSLVTALRYSLIVLVPMVLVLAGMFLWSRALRKQVAKQTRALRKSREKYQALFDNAGEVIMVASNGRLQLVNERIFNLLGYTPEELAGKPFIDFIHPEDRQLVMDRHVQRTAGKDPVNVYTFRVIHRSGDVKWVEINVVPIEWDGKAATLSFLEDITRRIAAQEEYDTLQNQMRQAQKMESVGRLAGGVAHDFNNMLSVILGHVDLIIINMDSDDPLYADLVEIRTAARRSADITRQLLAFARKQTIAPRVLDLNQTVEGMLKMLRRLIGEDIDLAWMPATDLWPVKMDPSQLDQILANLCVNARDAIADVGKITIETGKTTFDTAYCANHPGFIPGDFVLLAVSDDGCGMDKQTMENLFDPFFTTKDIHKGTGLGLATVYGIVKQNNGFINVYSEPGHGSTFRIYLSRHTADADAEAPLPMQEPAVADIPKDETILLVEDEPAILTMTTKMLRHMGCTVLAADTPEKAMNLAREHEGHIDLIITDVVMPGMNGPDLATNLLSLYPDLKCLFMSGYTANVIAHHGVLDEGMHFIQKPFTKQDLTNKIQEALKA